MLKDKIQSSLLYTKEDGTKDFVHDTYRDFFLAKWFADRINDGRLTMRDAYNTHWKDEEDRLTGTIYFCSGFLNDSSNLVEILIQNNQIETAVNCVPRSKSVKYSTIGRLIKTILKGMIIDDTRLGVGVKEAEYLIILEPYAEKDLIGFYSEARSSGETQVHAFYFFQALIKTHIKLGGSFTKPGMERQRNFHLNKSVEYCNLVSKFVPHDHEILYLLGQTYGLLGGYDQALERLSEAYDYAPNNFIRSYILQGIAFVYAKQQGKSDDEIQEIMRRF